MKKTILIPILAAALLAVIGGGAAYVYFFSNLRSSPAALALASPSPSAPGAASPDATASPAASPGSNSTVAGTWHTTAGSIAGYRVAEQFIGQTASHDAVARTGDVSGELTASQSGGAYLLDSTTITVQLGSLQSTDSVAGYNVSNRDRIVSNRLSVGQYPTAIFSAGPIPLPATLASGQPLTVDLPGKLTIHGVTRAVTARVQLRVTDATAQAAGSISIVMTDFGVSPPTIGFTTVQPAVTVEFQINLAR